MASGPLRRESIGDHKAPTTAAAMHAGAGGGGGGRKGCGEKIV